MESINHDLQASYSVIKLLEGSNINSERVFQSLPGVFAIINEKCEILRGNQTLATHLAVTTEEVLRKPFCNLFTDESWAVFSDYMYGLKDPNKDIDHCEFELGIEDPDMISGQRAYYWHLKKMDVISRSEGTLVIIIGEDISQLRDSEQKLVEIFASIPLGIFTIDTDARIEAFHSACLEQLLHTHDLPGKTIREVLFEPAMAHLTEKEKEGAVSVEFVLGQGMTTYEMLEPFFPKQIFFPINGSVEKGRWLKIMYQPVVYRDTVKRMLITLEDRTEIVKSREMKKKARLLDDQSVQRVFQLKQVDKKGLHLYVKELNHLVKRLRGERSMEIDRTKQFATVHGIKGIARVAGFSFLQTIAGGLELHLKQESASTEQEEESFNELFNEFSDLLALYKAIYPHTIDDDSPAREEDEVAKGNDDLGLLFSQYKELLDTPSSLNRSFQIDQVLWGLHSYHYDFISSLEEGLANQVSTTAESLGKKVRVRFDWNHILVKTTVLSALNECLVHLLNNAVDHGIEAPEKREKLNKDSLGKIRVNVTEQDSVITCEVIDDGAGIDSGTIRETAARKNIKTTMELAEMEDEEVLQLIFHPGFSTAKELSAVSGRGIGMEAVMANLEKKRGAIFIDSEKDRGTRIQFSFQLIGRDDLQFAKRCYPLAYLKKALTDFVKAMRKENGFDIKMRFDEGFDKGVYYGDLTKAVVGFTTFIGSYACKGSLSVHWSLVREFYIKCSCKLLSSSASPATLPQFSAPLQLCRYFILKDKGILVEVDTMFEIQVPYYFHKKGAPKLVVGYTPKVDQKHAKATFRKIREVAEELDMDVEFSGDKSRVNMLIYPVSANNQNKHLLPYPGFTVSSPKKMIQQDLLNGIERLVALEKRKNRTK